MIKCGIDIINIERLAKINSAIRARFLKRVYTEKELAQAQNQNDSLSGLFAAKESVSKALGTGIGFVTWQDIEILHLPSGEPILHLHGNALLVAEQKGLSHWSISISHEKEFAIAMAVAMSQEVQT